MRTHITSISLACLIALAGPVAADTILQWGFDYTTGAVAVPIADDSGANHPGTTLQGSGGATYSADIPSAAKTQNVTGIGSVNFATGTHAGIARAQPATAAQIWTAGGLTMEVWVKNPVKGGQYAGFALCFGDGYNLGISSAGRIGFSTAWGDNVDTNDYAPGVWNHLAAVIVPTTADCGSYNISAYLNGRSIGSRSITRGFLSRVTVVGNASDGNVYNNYNGLVYEPRISLGVLTPSQFTVTTGPPAGGYDAWAGSPDGYGLTGGAAARGADPDGDGFTNLQEFLFGTSPVAGNGTLVTSETVGGDLVLHWLQHTSGCSYLLQESITMGAGDWSTSAIMPELDVDQSGVPTGYERYKATIPIGVARKFFRVEGTEN